MRRGLCRSRQEAREAVEAGRVLVSGSVADKPTRMVGADEPVVISGPPPRFVSRGGEKLDAALDRFGISVRNKTAIDCGASTGGFTDCLLSRGAERVVAVDVGYGQLAERIRGHPGVEVRERTNIRHLRPDDVGRFPVVVADLSFISLTTVAGPLVDLAKPDGDLVLLVKPQFEAGPKEASKGKGIIRDPTIWGRVLRDVRAALETSGAAMIDVMVSPLRGAEGNVEFLVHFRAGAEPEAGDWLIDEAVKAASG